MTELGSYVDWVKEQGAEDAKLIDTSTIVVESWVRLKCLYGCTRSGGTYSCPPYNNISPEDMKKVVSEYKVAILVKIDRWSKVYKLIYDLERKLFLAGYPKVFGLVAGACALCKECALKTKEPCRIPEKVRPALESVGVNVFETVKNNGYDIKVATCETDLRTYFGMVLCY